MRKVLTTCYKANSTLKGFLYPPGGHRSVLSSSQGNVFGNLSAFPFMQFSPAPLEAPQAARDVTCLDFETKKKSFVLASVILEKGVSSIEIVPVLRSALS